MKHLLAVSILWLAGPSLASAVLEARIVAAVWRKLWNTTRGRPHRSSRPSKSLKHCALPCFFFARSQALASTFLCAAESSGIRPYR